MIAIIVLLVLFIIGAIFPLNIGMLGLAAAFIVGVFIYGLSLDSVISQFPVDLFVFIVGITYLVTIIQKSGAIDWLTDASLRSMKGNAVLIPWFMFTLSLVLASVGTFGVAIVTLLAPFALKLAYQFKINQLMLSIMIVMGMQAGAFSPLNIFGVVVNSVMLTKGLEHSPMILFLNCMLYFGIVACITFLLFEGARFFKQGSTEREYVAAAIEGTNEGKNTGMDLYKAVCLAAIPVLGILSFVFDINLGIAALLVGLVLSFLSPKKQRFLKAIPWGIAFLVTGILTYVGVMEQIGIMDDLTVLLEEIDNPAIAGLAFSYMGGFVSSFASTTGFLTAIIPMAESVLINPEMSSIDVVSAISVSSSIVDLSPLSTLGAILLANVQGINERLFFKQLLLTTVIFIAIGPGLAWLLFIVIGTSW